MQTILVTGGAGYVGSHCCKALAAAGYRPVVYDDLRRGDRGAVRWGPLEIGALEDKARLADVIDRYRPIAVMHFAAYIFAGESVEDPLLYWQNNVGGSLALVDAAHHAGIEHLVFSSTAATYGIPEAIPVPTEQRQRPINPYGSSKVAIELLLNDMAPLGLRSAILRYFNAAGADPDGEIGEAHDPEPHLIPRVLQVANRRLPHLDIFGNDYATPDGTAVRDYIHVSDLADAHVLALRRLVGGGDPFTVCLGAGRGVSVRAVVTAAEMITGRPIPIQIASRRPGDPPVLIAETRQAQALLDFVPRRSDITTILESAWRWECRTL